MFLKMLVCPAWDERLLVFLLIMTLLRPDMTNLSCFEFFGTYLTSLMDRFPPITKQEISWHYFLRGPSGTRLTNGIKTKNKCGKKGRVIDNPVIKKVEIY